ncbi:MAG: hypothetical protein HYV09_35060 [Deltaproteobacteria bacterium]|nr:hypothetical protein [Deltaproteobacteria bacterium]
MSEETAEQLGRRWARVIVALRTAQLRVAWLRETLRALPATAAADALEGVCAAADAGDERAEALLHALVELFADPDMDEARASLRDEARARKLLSLERLLRRPFVARPRAQVTTIPGLEDDIAVLADQEQPRERDVPDYGRGRPLTLGERKALARRPPPSLLPKILADPHPDVIRNLLAAPRLTEDDVVRLVTRRPNRSEVLQEVARHPRWCQRPRVRNALVLNPATPQEIAIAMVALLRRPELRDVMEAKALHPAVRAAAQERFARRPPMRPGSDGSVQ